ncbi:probable calcium-binding protein CML22 isoform X2 [Rhododendron vialii]|uniref:probable calcium-binding protein CML22 isoform X2 n=1 Tax=Rhododendron vialii TaxID=182163 RepID=UPI00265EAF57|nr:probable calcium-binding protein CML22 isoform X2 [Rhododendron vialii]
MKDSLACPALKSLSHKVGGMFCCHNNSANTYKRLDTKVERKMMEIKRSTSKDSNFRSVNGIILRFPQIKEGLKDIRGVFEQLDEDSNGTIDREELNKCLDDLQFHLAEKEIDDIFQSCDVNGSEGIQFKEFIVLLCLIYLLMDHSYSPQATSQIGSPQLKATFDTIIEAFLFLDKNGDGKLNKKDMAKSLNEDSPWEKAPAHITRSRFQEMDWDRNGKVTFREFLFSLINWIGIDTDDDNPMIEW